MPLMAASHHSGRLMSKLPAIGSVPRIGEEIRSARDPSRTVRYRDQVIAGTCVAQRKNMFNGLRKPPIPMAELVKRTAKEVIDDDCLGMAAQLAYYLVLALFPALIVIVALV